MLSRDRSFLLEGTLAPRGSVPPELERSLQLLDLQTRPDGARSA